MILDYRTFQVEVKLSGPTKNAHLRQALLQIVQAIQEHDDSFGLFQILPERSYYYENLSDRVWRAKHSHTIRDPKQAGYELRQKRLKLKLSGREFARLLDVHHTYLSHVEHGRRPVSEALRKKAESVFRSRAREIRQRWKDGGYAPQNHPLGVVVHEGQTFFEDLQLPFNNVDELKEFFDKIED